MKLRKLAEYDETLMARNKNKLTSLRLHISLNGQHTTFPGKMKDFILSAVESSLLEYISNRMKNRIYFSMVFATVFMFSCQPPVVFDKPQPADVRAMSGFPERLQGQYLSSGDSSVLEITANAVIRKYNFEMKVHISQLDSNLQIIGDTLFNTKTNEGMLVQIEADSIVQHIRESDTLFVLDENNVLKKFKGYYFLNMFNPPVWQVKKLELSRGKLILSSINNKEDLDQLRALTETPQDTAIFKFSLNRSQFREFVRNEGFRDSETFSKISN